ncbi:carbohydrate ABC transporter permease [Brachybacterium paraconglomeratum]|uniref:carbohydrate ABC transporter permease n=1 Tax=Brachybacterium paraconglomeratum TaxID=173362 RepID=UPI0021A8D9C0|nr:sugar ABC transporter permease [Brachybacterium paraconglomeratum]MCT1910238.1 sugar ABC transporter permease [Brachybacterium paraconglomeratum]
MSSVTDRRGVLSAQRRRDRLVRGRPRLLFLTPAVVLVGLLALLPFALTVGRSFLDDAVVDPSFAGLSSYSRLVTDPVIVRSSINTLFWLVGTVVIPVGLGLAIAALTNSVSWGKYARLAIVLPYALSGTAVAVVWNFVLQDTGALNSLLRGIGLDALAQPWLLNWPGNTIALIIANSWQATGVAVILYLVGLQGIPRETIEAAALDGVDGIRRFRLVVVPQLRTSTAVVMGISLANGLKSFDLIWVLTNGGPGRATETLAVSMYWQSFVLQRPGSGAAIAVVLTIIVVAVSVAYLRKQLRTH